MKHIQLYFIGVLLLACACSTNNQNYDTGFTTSKQISGELLETEDGFLGRPGKMIIIDSILIAIDVDEKNFLDIINIKTNKFLKRFGKKGSGPGECISPFGIYRTKSRDFAIHDISLKTIFSFSLDSVLSNSEYQPHPIVKLKNTEGVMFFSTLPLNDNLIVGTGISESGRYILADSTGRVFSSKFEYPPDPEHESTPFQVKAMAYQVKLDVNPEKNRIASATSSAGILEILEIDGNNVLNKIKDIHWHNPSYVPDMSKKGVSAVYTRENRFGFSDITSNRNYIYALYSGRIFKDDPQAAFKGNNIYVFDWNGTPVNHYVLDKDLTSICVNDGGVLYGLTETPEPILIKYSLQ